MFSVKNIPLTNYVSNILFHILDDIICKVTKIFSIQFNDQDQDQHQEPSLQLENPLQVPELNHNSPIAVPTPKPLTLFIYSVEEQPKPMTYNDFISEHFILVNPNALLSNNHPESLSIEKLNKLNKGFLGKNIEEFKINRTITFPDGTIIDI
jgi:hypothetical protein